MKRLNNKGITTIEVIISFVIVVIITTSLYTTVSNYNQKRLIENYKSKIYTYKNTLTKEIQDDFIKIGLTHASYDKDYDGTTTVHTVNCDLKDGTKRTLIVTQRFTDSTYHHGDPSVDDYFMIQYGNQEANDMLDYPLPNVGESVSENGKIVYDLSINNVLINIEDENILSIYIGFYHPELMTRYGINIICPIDFVSKGVDNNSKFNVREITKSTKRYTFNANGGSGIINPIAATVGQPFEVPGKGHFVRQGYSLIEWNTQPDGSGNTYALGETVIPTAIQSNTITLYAQWQEVANEAFAYAGMIETYTIPMDGRYKLEAWGASGGATMNSMSRNSRPGLGGYTMAEVYLTRGEVLYIGVGGRGFTESGREAQDRQVSSSVITNDDNSINDTVGRLVLPPEGGFNGGGDAGGLLGSGGGATHIAKVNGILQNLSGSKNKVIIVAGGGGGACQNRRYGTVGDSNDCSGGSAGGTIAQNGYKAGKLMEGSDYISFSSLGGTQDKGFSFGKGEDGGENDVTGGGGGWYGGFAGGWSIGAGGGSGYINKDLVITGKMYCYGCPSDSDTVSTTDYSEDPVPNKPKLGYGHAKITFISD